jgi:hypothetical protein
MYVHNLYNAIMGPRFYVRARAHPPPKGEALVRAETNAHVHWVPLDAKPGEQVDLVFPAPRTHEAIRAVGLCLGGLDGKQVSGFWSLGMREHIVPKGLICGWFENEADWRGGYGCRSERRRKERMGEGGKGCICACRISLDLPACNENPRSGMLPLGDGWLRGSGDENASQKGV